MSILENSVRLHQTWLALSKARKDDNVPIGRLLMLGIPNDNIMTYD